MKSLDTWNWKEFHVGDVFTVIRGKSYWGKSVERTLGVESWPNGLPHVSKATSNNGIEYYVPYEDADKYTTYKGNCVTVPRFPGNSGNCAFYQNREFFCSDGINIVTNNAMNKYIGLFVGCLIGKAIEGKYNMSRTMSVDMLKDETIPLPVTYTGAPDYGLITEYMKEMEDQVISALKDTLDSIETNNIFDTSEMDSITNVEQKEFTVEELFNVKTGRVYTKGNIKTTLKEGDHAGVPHVARSTSDNGTDCYIPFSDSDEYVTYPGNCITVSSLPHEDGTCAFYQPEEFFCGTGVNVLTSDKITRESAIYLCNCINRSVVGRYGMSHVLGASALKSTVIRIPVTADGQPDYDLMSKYIGEREREFTDKLRETLQTSQETE